MLSVTLLRFVPILKIESVSPWLMPIGFGIKVLVGLFFVYIYSYHYGVGELTADSSEFLVDSKTLNEVFYKSPSAYFKFMLGIDDRKLLFEYLSETTQWDGDSNKWFNDVRNLLRLHSLIHFFSFGNIVIHLMVTSMICLFGIRYMVMALTPYVKVTPTFIFFAILMMPNVLFWSSGILKEPLIFFSIGLFLYTILRQHSPFKKGMLLLISILLLIGIKVYILICLLPAIAIYLLFEKIKNIKIALSITFIIISGAILSLLTPPLKPVVSKLSDQQFDFVNIGKGGVFARADTCIYIIYGADMPFVIVDKVDSTVFLTQEVVGDYIQPYAKKDKKRCTIQPNEKPWKLYYDGDFSGSYIETTPIEGSAVQLIKNIPEAITNSMFRPFPNDPPKSKFKYLSIIDNWGLIVLFLSVLLFFRKQLTRKEINLLIPMAVFCLTLSLLIGWTTPVLGAIVRYKIPIQLAIMFATLILIEPQKLRK